MSILIHKYSWLQSHDGQSNVLNLFHYSLTLKPLLVVSQKNLLSGEFSICKSNSNNEEKLEPDQKDHDTKMIREISQKKTRYCIETSLIITYKR